MATLLLKSQYDGFYTRLNNIRKKHGKANIPASTVTANTPALSTQMSTLQSSITTVKTTTDGHLTRASINTTIPNIAKGNTILLSTKTSIDSILTAMYNVCHHDSSDYSCDDYDGSSYHSSCDGHNSSNYTSCNSYTCSYCPSDRGDNYTGHCEDFECTIL